MPAFVFFVLVCVGGRNIRGLFFRAKGDFMTLYQYYSEMEQLCRRQAALAQSCTERAEMLNIADGFMLKRMKLSLCDASKRPTDFQVATYWRQNQRLKETLSARGRAS